MGIQESCKDASEIGFSKETRMVMITTWGKATAINDCLQSLRGAQQKKIRKWYVQTTFNALPLSIKTCFEKLELRVQQPGINWHLATNALLKIRTFIQKY